ncbi:hypothetical protein BH18ACT4_BH18ACT4_02770 [soil metagenome]
MGATGCSPSPRSPSSGAAEPAVDDAAVEAALAAVPLSFVENRGQVDGPVSFYVDGPDTSLFFTPEGVTFALGDDEPSPGAEQAAAGEVAAERWA